MHRFDIPQRLLAFGLAALAGFVDAVGFLNLGGLFASFMSGNSTRMAVGRVMSMPGSLMAGALIAAFVTGVIFGATIGRLSGRWRKQSVLMLVVSALTLAAGSSALGAGATVASLLMAGAMGSANAVFQRDGEVSVGVTYMTGTLVKLGQHIASALTGGPRFAWAPHFFLWFALVAGAMSGAAAYPALKLQALWIAVAVAGLLLACTAGLGPVDDA